MFEMSTNIECYQLSESDFVVAANFAEALTEKVATVEHDRFENGVKGIGLSALNRYISTELGIEVEHANKTVENLVMSGDLCVVGNVKGTKIVSVSSAVDACDGQPDQYLPDQSVHEAEVDKKTFSQEQLIFAERILNDIASARSVGRGVKLKALWTEEPKFEKQIRHVVNKLAHKKNWSFRKVYSKVDANLKFTSKF